MLSLNRPLSDTGVITARKRSLGQGNIFTPVCHSVHRGGVCLSACWDTTHWTMHPLPLDHAPPGTMHPSSTCTPPDHAPPPNRPCTTPTPRDHAPPPTPRDHAPPPATEHTWRHGQRAGGTHPTGMHSCCK